MGLLVILSTVSIGMAYYNIKRLQVEQHRAWMLRAMFYLGIIITIRIIMVIAAQVTSAVGKYYVPMSCDEISFIQRASPGRNDTIYSQCTLPNMTTDGVIAVAANFGSGRKEQLQASLELNFGMAAWIAIFLHTVGVEIYLNLTPAEGERLRRISYEKQLEAGMKNPGSAGLTIDGWGDAEKWVVPAEDALIYQNLGDEKLRCKGCTIRSIRRICKRFSVFNPPTYWVSLVALVLLSWAVAFR